MDHQPCAIGDVVFITDVRQYAVLTCVDGSGRPTEGVVGDFDPKLTRFSNYVLAGLCGRPYEWIPNAHQAAVRHGYDQAVATLLPVRVL